MAHALWFTQSQHSLAQYWTNTTSLLHCVLPACAPTYSEIQFNYDAKDDDDEQKGNGLIASHNLIFSIVHRKTKITKHFYNNNKLLLGSHRRTQTWILCGCVQLVPITVFTVALSPYYYVNSIVSGRNIQNTANYAKRRKKLWLFYN